MSKTISVRLLLALGIAAAGGFAPAQAQQKHRAIDIAADCAPCHGNEGVARDRDVPNLAGQNDGYLYNQLKAFQSGKRPHKEMKYMSRQMTNAEMEAIADYYANLPR